MQTRWRGAPRASRSAQLPTRSSRPLLARCQLDVHTEPRAAPQIWAPMTKSPVVSSPTPPLAGVSLSSSSAAPPTAGPSGRPRARKNNSRRVAAQRAAAKRQQVADEGFSGAPPGQLKRMETRRRRAAQPARRRSEYRNNANEGRARRRPVSGRPIRRRDLSPALCSSPAMRHVGRGRHFCPFRTADRAQPHRLRGNPSGRGRARVKVLIFRRLVGSDEVTSAVVKDTAM